MSDSKPWTNKPSGTMRAMALANPSNKNNTTPPASCFVHVELYPKPTLPGPEWLLVKVIAAGLNRAELRARAGERNIPQEWGKFAPYFSDDAPIPKVLGEDFIGIVEGVGTEAAKNHDGKAGWKVGDRVAGAYSGGGKAYDGAYAEYTIIHYSLAGRVPGPEELEIANEGKVTWTDIGAVPGSAWTAWASLFQSAQTEPGQVVFIHGATSSVGVWAILLAKSKGCTVIATTRQASKIDKLKAAGADHIIVEEGSDSDPKNYAAMSQKALQLAPKGVNTFVELANTCSIIDLAFKCTAPYGYIVTTGVLNKAWSMKDFAPPMIPATRRLTNQAGVECLDQFDECLRTVTLGIQNGTFKRESFLDSVFALSDVGKAHERMEANQAVGKVVLSVAA